MEKTLQEWTAVLKRISDGYAKQFNIHRSEDWALLKVQEELGELVACHLALTGRSRPKGRTPAEEQEQLRHELADVLAMLLIYAESQGIDPEQALAEKWLPYLDRP